MFNLNTKDSAPLPFNSYSSWSPTHPSQPVNMRLPPPGCLVGARQSQPLAQGQEQWEQDGAHDTPTQ